MSQEPQKEIFGQSGWWEEDGSHRLLRAINPTRLDYVKDKSDGISGKSIVDVGCGGGIFSEGLAKAGANVIGIDPSKNAIKAAKEHAQTQTQIIDYQVASLEDYAKANANSTSLVTCMEILEHVEDPKLAVKQLACLLLKKGSLFLSTINRTPVAYATMIVGLEKTLDILPDGAHDYNRFIKPQELATWCRDASLKVVDVVGVNWSFFGKRFRLSQTMMPVNYFIHAVKK